MNQPSEWISVKDRLPPDETPVITLYTGIPHIMERRLEHPTYEEIFMSFWYWDNPQNDGQNYDDADVTHWMPLPAPPKENV